MQVGWLHAFHCALVPRWDLLAAVRRGAKHALHDVPRRTQVTDLLINMVAKAARQNQEFLLDLAALQVGGVCVCVR